MKKAKFIKEILHSDVESLQRWKDLEYRTLKPNYAKPPEHLYGTEDWKAQVQEIRFRNNMHMGL